MHLGKLIGGGLGSYFGGGLGGAIGGMFGGGIDSIFGGGQKRELDPIDRLADYYPPDLKQAYLKYRNDIARNEYNRSAAPRLEGNVVRTKPKDSSEFPLTTERAKAFYDELINNSSKHNLRWLQANAPDIGEQNKNTNNNNTIITGGDTSSVQADGSSSANGGSVASPATIAGLPTNLRPGYDTFVNDTGKATDDYSAKNDQLWNDYLTFEKQYFQDSDQNRRQYNTNISNLPSMSFAMPASMGGATFDIAPKQHQKLYDDRALTTQRILDSEAANKLAMIPALDTLAGKNLSAQLTQAGNALLPTTTALDLYELERRGQLGIDQTREARKPVKKSAWSTWAPVVGQLVTTGKDGKSILGGAVDTVKGWFGNGTNNITGGSDTLASLPTTGSFSTSDLGSDYFTGYSPNDFGWATADSALW